MKSDILRCTQKTCFYILILPSLSNKVIIVKSVNNFLDMRAQIHTQTRNNPKGTKFKDTLLNTIFEPLRLEKICFHVCRKHNN